ncbi:hypothetical protein ACW2QC_13595 [Virgibacillus sp. FSP13]
MRGNIGARAGTRRVRGNISPRARTSAREEKHRRERRNIVPRAETSSKTLSKKG